MRLHGTIAYLRRLLFSSSSPWEPEISTSNSVRIKSKKKKHFYCEIKQVPVKNEDRILGPSMIMCRLVMVTSHHVGRWCDDYRGNWRTRGTICSSDILETANRTWSYPGLKPCIRGEKQDLATWVLAQPGPEKCHRCYAWNSVHLATITNMATVWNIKLHLTNLTHRSWKLIRPTSENYAYKWKIE
jgi:hypothetical protein